MFNIQVEIGTIESRYSIPYSLGLIMIGEEQKEIELPLCYWKKEDYERHWEDQIRSFLDNKLEKTFLISQIYEPDRDFPEFAKSIELWPIFRDENKIFIQHAFLTRNEVVPEFSVDRAFNFIGQREIVDEDGMQNSEWETSVPSLQEFLRRKQSKKNSSEDI